MLLLHTLTLALTHTNKHTHTGAGFGQVYAVGLLSTYYASLMALICNYLIDSFKNPLPWSDCRPEWPNCVAASSTEQRSANSTSLLSNPTALTNNTSTTLLAAGLGNVSDSTRTAKVMGSSEFYFM